MGRDKLLDANRRPYSDHRKGEYGGHRRNKGYGRMDCPAALRALAKGGYVPNRVFFANEATAVAAGFRPCGACLRERYQQWKADPDTFKRTVLEHATITIALPYAPPLDQQGLLDFLALRAVPGVERVNADTYERTLGLPHGPALVNARFAGENQVVLEAQLSDPSDRDEAVQRIRNLLDLDADAPTIDAQLQQDPELHVELAPGKRSPGAADGPELAVRAVLGQQVSVAAARTIAGRLAQSHGAPTGHPDLPYVFPTSAALAAIDPETLPMPRSRGRTLTNMCRELADGHPLDQLEALPGIGPWTQSYVDMRALKDPDAFMPTDLGVKHALTKLGLQADRAERWRPYRAYALHHLWAALSR